MNELDQALSRIHLCSFEYGVGETSHAAMVVGALDALGHKSLIEAFLDVYLPRLGLLGDGEVIPSEARSTALGSVPGEDWLRTLEVESESAGWQDLLRQQLPVLLEGAFGVGLYGSQRASWAVRNLEVEDSAERRTELLFALSYWASRYVPVPVRAGLDPERGWTPRRILAEFAGSRPSADGFETRSDALASLSGSTPYQDSLKRADLDDQDPSDFLSELCAEAAGLYLENPEHRLVYAHGLIGASGFRYLIPYLGLRETKSAMGVALHSVAAPHSLYGGSGGRVSPAPEAQPLSESWDEMRYRAACSLSEPVTELTEVCWREDQIHPDPRFRLAAADAILELGFSRGGRGG